MDATQIDQVIPETQAIMEYDKDKFKDFLEKSWANMAYLDTGKEQEEDISPEHDFQLVTSKRRNKKTKSKNNTTSRSITKKSSI